MAKCFTINELNVCCYVLVVFRDIYKPPLPASVCYYLSNLAQHISLNTGLISLLLAAMTHGTDRLQRSICHCHQEQMNAVRM
jgi:hypothetical protein